ncbi:M50 family metallopeptidase, partial [Clostridium tertium]
MSKNKKNIKEILYFIITFLLMLGCGFIAGFLGTKHLDQSALTEISFLGSLFSFILFLSSILVQTILHEAGHLVFGLMSGYEFVSFRVGKFTLIKENNKFCIKKFTVKGTGGQCLMMPKIDDY